MGNCAIVGINWGDEGKGRMVDLLTQDYDIVVIRSSMSTANLPCICCLPAFSARAL